MTKEKHDLMSKALVVAHQELAQMRIDNQSSVHPYPLGLLESLTAVVTELLLEIKPRDASGKYIKETPQNLN